jgi:hypothetical protein
MNNHSPSVIENTLILLCMCAVTIGGFSLSDNPGWFSDHVVSWLSDVDTSAKDPAASSDLSDDCFMITKLIDARRPAILTTAFPIARYIYSSLPSSPQFLPPKI